MPEPLTPEALAATMTPGRAAHKAFWDAVGPELAGQPRDWTWETSQLRDHWERAARAAQLATLPKFLGRPDDLCDQWLDESYELDEGDPAWDREDMQSAYREGRDEARRQLAPAHAAITAERDELRTRLNAARDIARTATRERAAAELQEVHDLLVAAYGRDDLSEDTPAVVAGLIGERDTARADLDAALKTVARWQGENQRLIAERDAHRLRADHYEGRWRAEHGLPPDGRSFEDMLADPGEQFDPRSELLASIAAYAAAPPASAGSQPWEPGGDPRLRAERNRYRAALEYSAAYSRIGTAGHLVDKAREALEGGHDV